MAVGMVLQNFRGIAPSVESMLEPANYEKFRASLGKLNNRAVFEIPVILNGSSALIRNEPPAPASLGGTGRNWRFISV